MRSIMLATGISLGLTGCLSVYQVPPNAETAEFSMAAQSDSPSAILRTTYVWVFKDEQCARSDLGIRAGASIHNDKSSGTPPQKILASERFVFTATYGESHFGQNRQCGITGAFQPQPRHTYKANLVVDSNVDSCKLGVYDTTSGKDEEIEFTMPQYVCIDSGKSTRLNGQPLWTNIRVTVIRN